MPFTEDLAAFTDPSDFGVAGLYTPSGGTASTVNGIFDAEYQADNGMEGSGPAFSCDAADVPSVAHGDALVIDDVDYVVRGVKPDGTGWVVLILELP